MRGSSTAKGQKTRCSSTKPSVRTRSQLTQGPSPSPVSKTIAEHQGVQSLLQKPQTGNVRETAVAATQQVNFEQSIQIMQTLLHACLSIVLFQRSIFPFDCYESRYYVNNSDQWTYADYLGARQGIIKGDGAGGPMLVLKRNVSGRVDRFLELLETGIFDAMRRGFLRSLRLSIYEDTEHPDDILESWALTINYKNTGPAGDRLAYSFNVKEGRGTDITLSEAKLSLNDFIRKLTGICSALPVLPAEKNIILEIIYTEDRPETYFAPGFPHPVYALAKFPSNDQWEKVISDVAVMSTSRHDASLRVSYLRNMAPGNENALPSTMICSEEASKLDEVMSDIGERAAAILNSRPKSKNSRPGSASLSTPTFAQKDFELTRALNEISPPHPEQWSDTGSSPVVNQSSGTFDNLMKSTAADHLEQEQLRSMLRSPPSGSNTQATQPVFRSPVSLSRVKPATRLVFSSLKIDQTDRDRDATLLPRKERSQIWTAYEHMNRLTMQCTCGHQEEEGDMIECEFCDTYQHVHCCGYMGKDDARIPVVHICYRCLLKDEEKSLHQVQDQSVYRRALWLLKGTSFSDAKSFAHVLHCTKAEVDRLIKKFRGQGLVTPSSSSYKKGNSAIVLSQASAALEVIRRSYFDPSFGIAHHLEKQAEIGQTSGGPLAKSSKRAAEEEALPSSKRIMCASGASFINGSEAHTPKTAKKQ